MDAAAHAELLHVANDGRAGERERHDAILARIVVGD